MSIYRRMWSRLIPASGLILVSALWLMSLVSSHTQVPSRIQQVPSHTQPALDFQTESLINALPHVSQSGCGFDGTATVSQFLPDKDSAQVYTLLLGEEAPQNSPLLEKIVRRSFRAVPSLLKHLDDKRKTRVPPLKGMMWTSYNDEYDFNHQVRKVGPTGVNKEDTFSGAAEPHAHTITVGDLCFVALGQIVNRDFNAARYQPTAGLVVNSPTESKTLCAVARADFQGLDEKQHRSLLIQDFVEPDNEFRRIGAYQRLAFYYPNSVEPLVLNQLSVPHYDIFAVENFVRNHLYKAKSQASRQKLFNAFRLAHGSAASEGIMLQLFDDLNWQEAADQHRLHPVPTTRYEAKALLIQLFGFKATVKSTDRPYRKVWESASLARFIEVLKPDKNPKIDTAVYRIFSQIDGDDGLALACMKRLTRRGYQKEIRRYCKRRIPKSQYYASELRQMLKAQRPRVKKTGASHRRRRPTERAKATA